MTTETEVFALFEEGNPVPDLDGLGSTLSMPLPTSQPLKQGAAK